MNAPAVLITGASGFVGRHLLSALATDLPAARLIPASRRSGIAIDGLPATAINLEQPESIGPLLRSLQPDIVIHLAGEAFGPRAAADPMAAWRLNFWQTLELAESVRTVVPGCVFMLVSSADIYGSVAQPGRPISEDQGLNPSSPYGATKAAADLAIGEMALRGLHAIRMRPFNHTGPGQSAPFVIPALARQIALIEAGRQAAVIRTGSLDTARDFLDVRDVCAAYVKAVEHARDIPPGTSFNVASGQPRRIGDVLNQLLDISGVDAVVEIDDARIRPNEIRSVCGDSAKIRERLNWQPTIPFERTLSETLDWWRGQVKA